MPKSSIRTKRCELEEPYAGYHVTVRTNPPMQVYEDFSSGDLARILAALATVTTESDLTDDDDAPVDLTTPAGWRKMPSDLLAQVAARFQEALAIPKANANGSSMPSSQAGDLSHTTTT